MINRLFTFLNDSPVNFLAVKAVSNRLKKAGFKRFEPEQRLDRLEAGAKFFVTKNDSSIFAFQVGSKPLWEAGFHVICAHSDSPTFRIKPDAEIHARHGLVKLNVEVYGGAILSSWFDRPLSVAGRVILKTADVMRPKSRLLHIRRPIMTIPNLCIHFNRQVNEGVKVSVQKDMQPILGLIGEELERQDLLLDLICQNLNVEREEILDFDLYLYDTTAPTTFGAHNEFISAGRLDDLEMVSAGMEAMLSVSETVPEVTRVLAVFDNEETGSHTKQGAASPFFAQMLHRLVLAEGGCEDDYYRAVEHGFMVSADNAHAWHPNYAEKYDPVCHPVLGGGPAIKFNAAQKYASDALSAAIFQNICRDAGVPCQKFVNHSDVAGGSTLGNILTASLPVRGVDMGNAILAMHSIRETGSVLDYEYCVRAFTRFYQL